MTKKKLRKEDIANIGVILGQMSHAQPAIWDGRRMMTVDRYVFETWIKTLKAILEASIK